MPRPTAFATSDVALPRSARGTLRRPNRMPAIAAAYAEPLALLVPEESAGFAECRGVIAAHVALKLSNCQHGRISIKIEFAFLVNVPEGASNLLASQERGRLEGHRLDQRCFLELCATQAPIRLRFTHESRLRGG